MKSNKIYNQFKNTYFKSTFLAQSLLFKNTCSRGTVSRSATKATHSKIKTDGIDLLLDLLEDNICLVESGEVLLKFDNQVIETIKPYDYIAPLSLSKSLTAFLSFEITQDTTVFCIPTKVLREIPSVISILHERFSRIYESIKNHIASQNKVAMVASESFYENRTLFMLEGIHKECERLIDVLNIFALIVKNPKGYSVKKAFKNIKALWVEHLNDFEMLVLQYDKDLFTEVRKTNKAFASKIHFNKEQLKDYDVLKKSTEEMIAFLHQHIKHIDEFAKKRSRQN